MSESDIVRGCLELLRLRGVFAWRNNTGALKVGARYVRFGTPGASDIFAVLKPSGRLAGIEVKTRKGRQSIAQKIFEKLLVEHGGEYWLVRSVDDLLGHLDV